VGWGDKISSRGDSAADERGCTRVEMAGVADILMQNSCCSFVTGESFAK